MALELEATLKYAFVFLLQGGFLSPKNLIIRRNKEVATRDFSESLWIMFDAFWNDPVLRFVCEPNCWNIRGRVCVFLGPFWVLDPLVPDALLEWIELGTAHSRVL